MSEIVKGAGSKGERVLAVLEKSHRVGMDARGHVFVFSKSDPNPIAVSVNSKAFGRLTRKIAKTSGDFLTTKDVQEVAEQCLALAASDDRELIIHLRSAVEDGLGVVTDMGMPDGRRILLSEGKVSVISAGSSTLFYRPDSQAMLTQPADTGSLDQLYRFLNMVAEERVLFIAWLTFVLAHPKNAKVGYPLLLVIGESGTGKSTLCRILRAFLDPHSADVQLMPRNPRDLAASLTSQFVLVLDNVREISSHMSDTLCVVATGGTIACRSLYTNDDEHQTRVHAPVVMNSIHPAITQEDLASRVLTVHLRPITPDVRASEDTLLAEFNEMLPGIFRGLLDLAAQGLQLRESVVATNPTRMTTFSRWCAAMEGPLGMPKGILQDVYRANVLTARYETIMDNPLAMAAIKLATERGGTIWRGTPAELLRTLERATEQEYLTRGSWPHNPNAMSKRLKALRQLLEEQDVYLEFGRGQDRWITVQHRSRAQTAPPLDEPDERDDDGASSRPVESDS